MCNKKFLLNKLMEYPKITTNDYLELLGRKNKLTNNEEIELINNKINLYNEKLMIINMIKLSNVPFEGY
jgi:hypothetical protein